MAFTYIIIDSDITSNTKLYHHLEEYEEFKCIALTENNIVGLNTILKYAPNIVFINLDDHAESHFQMILELHQYGDYLPTFIGMSKSKDFVYQAIKNNFFDYWLLPINELEIRKSLLRLKKLKPEEMQSETICLKSYRDFQYINTCDILYLRADNNATEFIMKDGTVNNAFKTLKTFVGQMPKNFVRIHQSYIVNINYISGISYGKSICTLKLRKLQLPFSRSYRSNIDELKKILTKNVIPVLN